MALEDITEAYRAEVQHKNVTWNGTGVTSLISGEAGKRVKIFLFFISGTLAATLTLRSGSNTVFQFFTTNTWGVLERVSDKNPIFIGNVGESITIQSDVTAFSGSAYLQYVVE